jgi:hypothetical protein
MIGAIRPPDRKVALPEREGKGRGRRKAPLAEPRRKRLSKRRALPEDGFQPEAGAVLEGNCPFEGEWQAKAALAAGAMDKRKAARALES